ncbi:MAG: prepilin-type N-terminal cleavage/methylation domain-containing protein [bacterium]
MNTIRHTMKGTRGFTLVEIAIVVAIIGLLLLIALPLFSGARVRAYVAESRSLTSEWKALAWSCLVEKNLRESRCDTLAEHGYTPPADSDVWDWTGGTFLACGAADTLTPASLVTCAGAADSAASNAYIALVVPPFAGFIPGDNRYVLVIRTNTGKVQESPADGTVVPTP